MPRFVATSSLSIGLGPRPGAINLKLVNSITLRHRRCGGQENLSGPFYGLDGKLEMNASGGAADYSVHE